MTIQNPPIFVQEGSHPAEDTRRALDALAAGTSGYSSATALAVTERASLTNMSVDVAGGGVWVQGTESTFQGSYFCDNRGTTNVTIASADVTNPRIDLVVAQVEDSEYSGAVDLWSLAVVTGTPALSPTIPSAPANSVVLATVAVAALATTITNSDITDMRDLSQTAHGDVSIPGDLTVTGDVTIGGSLANQGLVLVKTQTIGGGVSSVTVTDAFSSTFDNYRIVWRAESTGAGSRDSVELQLVAGLNPAVTVNYKYAFSALQWDNNTFTLTSAAGTHFYVGATNGFPTTGSGSVDIYGPNLAKPTHYTCQNVYAGTADGWTGHGAGVQTDTTQFTSFVLSPDAGLFTGGTIRVYGYSNG